MPPTRRRRTGNTNTSDQQPTLSFKGTQSRITKPTATSHSTKDSITKPPLQTTTSTPKFTTAKDLLRTSREAYTIPPRATASASASPSSEKESAEPELEIEPETKTKTLPHHSKPNQNQKSKQPLAPTPTESAALSLTPHDLEKYWFSLESSRKAPRVHQSTTSTNEKILRHFDLSSEYGPCIGLSRMERWERAERLGLRPRVEVLSVLMREDGGGRSRFDELLG